MTGKRNLSERSGWVGLWPGVIRCLQLKLKKEEEQARYSSHSKATLSNRQRSLKPLCIR